MSETLAWSLKQNKININTSHSTYPRPRRGVNINAPATSIIISEEETIPLLLLLLMSAMFQVVLMLLLATNYIPVVVNHLLMAFYSARVPFTCQVRLVWVSATGCPAIVSRRKWHFALEVSEYPNINLNLTLTEGPLSLVFTLPHVFLWVSVLMSVLLRCCVSLPGSDNIEYFPISPCNVMTTGFLSRTSRKTNFH